MLPSSVVLKFRNLSVTVTTTKNSGPWAGHMTKKIFSSGIIFLGYKGNFQKSEGTCLLGSYGTENKNWKCSGSR